MIHSKISPSSLARFFACPASLDEGQKYPERGGSSYALQGDEEHAQGEALIVAALVERGFTLKAGGLRAVPEVVPSEVKTYVAGVIDRVKDYTGAVEVEERMESKVFPDFGGTADVLAVCPERKLLHVLDYKSGAGIPVTAKDNPQLLAYLLLAREQFPAAERFRVSVCQPRTSGPAWQDEEVTLAELNAFEDKLRALVDGPRDEFNAGEHCRFCPALAYCKEVRSHASNIQAKAIFLEGGDMPEKPDEATIEDWLYVKEIQPALEFYFKAVDEALMCTAQTGQEIPGHKVVRTWGRLKWKNTEDATLVELANEGVPMEEAVTTKILTPTQLAKKGYEDEVEALAERPESGYKLVKESAKGQAVDFRSAAQVFDEVERDNDE